MFTFVHGWGSTTCLLTNNQVIFSMAFKSTVVTLCFSLQIVRFTPFLSVKHLALLHSYVYFCTWVREYHVFTKYQANSWSDCHLWGRSVLFGNEYGMIKWVAGWLWSYLLAYLTGKDVHRLFGLSWKTSALFLWEDKGRGGGSFSFILLMAFFSPPPLFLFTLVCVIEV